MNSADHHRLTPVLVIACALLAVLLVVLWAGVGRGVHWDDNAEPARLPPLKAAPPPPSVPPLQDFANVWEHPLFSPDRKPIAGAADSGESADSSNLELTGVILLPGLHMALLREKNSGRTLRVREGQNADGVAVVEVKPRSAVVDAGGARSELVLKPGAAPGANAEDNAAAGPTPFEAAPEDQQGGTVTQPAATPAPGQPIADQSRARMLKARIEQRRRQAEARARLQQQQQRNQQQDPQQQE